MSDDIRQRIAHVRIDERTQVHRHPEVDHERAMAIFDLIEHNHFTVVSHPDGGPYTLALSLEGPRLLVRVCDESGETRLETLDVDVAALQEVIRDSFLITESYVAAVRRSSPSQIDAIANGRRALLEDGAARLGGMLSPQVDMDEATTRRLFTLIVSLHIKD